MTTKKREYPTPEDVGLPPENIRLWADRVIATWGLTNREMDCLRLLLKGMPDSEIASTMGNSVKTIKHHLHTIRSKAHCGSRSEIFAEILRL